MPFHRVYSQLGIYSFVGYIPFWVYTLQKGIPLLLGYIPFRRVYSQLGIYPFVGYIPKSSFPSENPQMEYLDHVCLYTFVDTYTYVLHLSMIRAVRDSVAKF